MHNYAVYVRKRNGQIMVCSFYRFIRNSEAVYEFQIEKGRGKFRYTKLHPDEWGWEFLSFL